MVYLRAHFLTPSRPAAAPVLFSMSNRRQVRERVLQALYAQELSRDDAEHVLDTLIRPVYENEPTYLRFAERLFLRSLDARDTAEEMIARHIQNWEIGRLALTDRLVLRMAIGELMYFEDIPPKVTLNEALEVAKAFSTEKSGAFVNGVLDAILTEMKEKNLLRKTGRGLVDVPSKSPAAN